METFLTINQCMTVIVVVMLMVDAILEITPRNQSYGVFGGLFLTVTIGMWLTYAVTLIWV